MKVLPKKKKKKNSGEVQIISSWAHKQPIVADSISNLKVARQNIFDFLLVL